MTERSLLLLLDFDACAQRDNGQASVFLHRRDRKFALTCEENGIKPNPRGWVEYVNRFSDSDSGQKQLTQMLMFWRWVNMGFAFAGACFGTLCMLGLLFYDGGQRISVTVIVAFVALQFFLAILTTIQSWVGWQPWLAVLKCFGKNLHSDISFKLHPVLMAQAAQLGGVWFAIAGLITLLIMVLLQDLAFGWSTTLDTNASTYHAIIAAIAVPWAWIWPAAVPEIGLVEATRFFRASTGQNDINPAIWGQWWPFIAMLWTTWALFPRCVLYFFSGILIRRKARRLLAKHPAMRALMYRMETETLETGYEHNDASDLPDLQNQLVPTPLPKATIMLTWAGAGNLALPVVLTEAKSMHAKIGGKRTLLEDQTTLEQVATQLGKGTNRFVLIVTQCWEPPTGELEDFINKAKELWPEGARIVLVPLANTISCEPEQHQVQQWLRFASRMPAKFVTVSTISSEHYIQNTQAGTKA